MYNVSVYLNSGEKITLIGINFIIKRHDRTYFSIDEENILNNFLNENIKLIIMEVM